MNHKDVLFDFERDQTTARQKKIKEIPLKQLEKWEMNENFIDALYKMNTDKIYVFNIVHRRGHLYYFIEQRSEYFILENRIYREEIDFIEKYFEGIGWEVFYELHGELKMKSLYIKGR